MLNQILTQREENVLFKTDYETDEHFSMRTELPIKLTTKTASVAKLCKIAVNRVIFETDSDDQAISLFRNQSICALQKIIICLLICRNHG